MPLKTLLNLVKNHEPQINQWFENKWENITPLPYFSCDIRHATFKMGCVDTNLFPGGFNNLCNSFTETTATALKNFFANNYPDVKSIALLAESHTRNKYYLLNVCKIKSLLEMAGLNCRVTMTENIISEKQDIPLTEELSLSVYKPEITEGILHLDGEPCDIILTNNDFSSGFPWEDIKTPIIPNENLGWHKRFKSQHFLHYNEVVQEFAQEFSFDPWLLTPLMSTVENIAVDSLDNLADATDTLIKKIQEKYDEYKIPESPYVFIKNDSGTYGLGIVSVFSGEDVKSLNRKKRNKLFSSKGETQSDRFLIQEGIPTSDTYSGFPIEPVMYGVGKGVVGGFFRIHNAKNVFESLNSPGMTFSCLCMHKLDEPHETEFINCSSKQELVKGSTLLAKIVALAAALELTG